MKSKVYFIDFRASIHENFISKLARLMNTAGIEDITDKRDITAVKLHFGELGNTAFIRPVFLRHIIQTLKKCEVTPFLTDTNTLYAGTRSQAPDHIQTAIQNGFAYSVVDAPVIIADGLRGKSEKVFDINQKNFKKVYIASEIANADSLLAAAHFKGHQTAGFGGTLKNLGMGCASRKGKLAQHSTVSPGIKAKYCKGCGLCIKHCSQGAIVLKKDKAVMDIKKCIGCGECIVICPHHAVKIKWNQTVPVFMESMVEYAMGALTNKKGKAIFLNFITNVSPDCDCLPVNDAPIVRDIGVAASQDPVAIDQASVDLVNTEPALEKTCLKNNTAPGEDKFKGIYPEVDWEIQLDYAQKIGVGTRDYELIRL